MNTGLFSVEGKTFEPWCYRPDEQPVVPLFDYGDSMSKVASSLDHVPSLKDYVNKAQPEEGWYSLLIHANGSDEVWGPNKKGDSFPEQWLNPTEKSAEYGYKTFEKKAMGYVHHRNTPDRWTGRVQMAGYNKPMGRAELIVKFNIQRLLEEGAPYFAEMLNAGNLPAVSMGCRVKFDLCSLCGNKAPTVMQYCQCLRQRRLETTPEGIRIRMLNYQPIFHDISLVSSPADPAARVLLKIASDEKVSDMVKNTPVQAAGGLRQVNKKEYEATLSTSADPDATLETLLKASRHNKHACYSSFTALGVILRPHEFATIELARQGNFAKAAEVYESRAVFPVYEAKTAEFFTWVSPDSDLVGELGSLIRDRSVYLPAFERRLASFEPGKTASLPESREVSVSDNIQIAYAGYRKVAEQALLDGQASGWVCSRPQLLANVLSVPELPLVVKLASLDKPAAAFKAVVRGASLPSNSF